MSCRYAPPWSEKYRPRSLPNVQHQPEIVDTLMRMMESKRVPHLLFYGPPGTGKTSTALALAHDLYGDEIVNRVMELNASDQRGIEIVRQKVKVFANMSVKSGDVPFKLIILDEADSMTVDAQAALRRIIEKYSHITRFILCANYVSRISAPLVSRCTSFRFNSLKTPIVVGYIRSILVKESLKNPALRSLTEASVELVVRIAGGDMRKATNLIQAVAHVVMSKQAAIDDAAVYSIAGLLPPEQIVRFVDRCGQSVGEVMEAVREILHGGFVTQSLVQQVYAYVFEQRRIRKGALLQFLTTATQIDADLVKGSNEFLQLLKFGVALKCALD